MAKDKQPKKDSDSKYPFLTRKSSQDKSTTISKGNFSKFIKKDGNADRVQFSEHSSRNGDRKFDKKKENPFGNKADYFSSPNKSFKKENPFEKGKSDRNEEYKPRFPENNSYGRKPHPFDNDKSYRDRLDRIQDGNRERRFPSNYKDDDTRNNYRKGEGQYESREKGGFSRNENQGRGRNFEKPNERFGRNNNRREENNKPFRDDDQSHKYKKRYEETEDGQKRRYSDKSDDKLPLPTSIKYRKSPSAENQRMRPYEKRRRVGETEMEVEEDGILRLNKFVAQTGLCSRRKAAELVKSGDILVNGNVEVNPAYEVQLNDVITHKGKVLKKEEKMVYLLMNKPKNTITSVSDEKGRKTVMDFVKEYHDLRIFPVGRLDRNTTGLLLLTNDGELASKLSHPSHKVKKIYHVILDRNLKPSDIDDIRNGIVLEDGPAEVDKIDYIKGATRNEIGIEIHIGKNRIVRRIFEHLGYTVEKLDRTYYAGLTKKDLPRGFSRELSEQEIIMLKHFTQGK
jgi:23S rRNA pseudouridine2605 synthase